MKILFAVHGFPPELIGGVELHTRELACALARLGHTIYVVAGTLAASSVEGDVELRREVFLGSQRERIEVVRIARHDLYFDHWHKSKSSAVSRAFRGLLREIRPDAVHVQHWIRLSRDLVSVAAREGIPSVISLHDSWASCPIVFRVRTDTKLACDAPVGPNPCIKCAGRVPPHTPWISTENAYMLLAERQRDIERELELARALVTPSAAHARALERHLGRAANSLSAVVIAPCAGTLGSSASVKARHPASKAPAVRVASWSQIARHKGLDLLVEVFLAAHKQLAGEVDLSLDVHGAEADPDYAAQLHALTRGSSVSWKGAYKSSELGQALDPRAQIFVSATRAHESYGVSADEACHLGLALLLPDVPVFVERFADVAEFYAAGQAASLTDQLVRLARQPRLLAEARLNASLAAARMPDNSSLALRHLELYERAIDAGAPAVPAESWFDPRMSAQASLDWDRALAQRSKAELGL